MAEDPHANLNADREKIVNSIAREPRRRGRGWRCSLLEFGMFVTTVGMYERATHSRTATSVGCIATNGTCWPPGPGDNISDKIVQ